MNRAAGPILLVVATAVGADPPKFSARSESARPPADLSAAIGDELDTKAVVLADDSGATATFWLRKALPVRDADSYRSIAAGTLIGVVRFARPWSDFRGQEAPAGVYTLRLAVQPDTKDHEGTSPFRDFVILVPVAADPKPDALPIKTLIEKSGTATGGTHPVVMLLLPYPKPAAEPTILNRDKKVFAVGVKGPGGMGFGFTVRGSGLGK
jgi:hypothetical protein